MTQSVPGPDGLILKAAELARSSPPQVWAGFLAELRVYADARKTECVQAPLAMLQVAQGRAQGTAQLLDLFEKAVNSADRIKASPRRDHSNPQRT